MESSGQDPSILQALADALQQNRQLTELVLDHNQLGPRGAEAPTVEGCGDGYGAVIQETNGRQ